MVASGLNAGVLNSNHVPSIIQAWQIVLNIKGNSDWLVVAAWSDTTLRTLWSHRWTLRISRRWLIVTPAQVWDESTEKWVAPLSSFFTERCLFNCTEFIIYLKSNYINIITSLVHEIVTMLFVRENTFWFATQILRGKPSERVMKLELTGDGSTGESQCFILSLSQKKRVDYLDGHTLWHFATVAIAQLGLSEWPNHIFTTWLLKAFEALFFSFKHH